MELHQLYNKHTSKKNIPKGSTECSLMDFTEFRSAIAEYIKESGASNLIPTTWLDPLLTGKDAVIGNFPFGCNDIEVLLKAIKKRIEEYEKEARA